VTYILCPRTEKCSQNHDDWAIHLSVSADNLPQLWEKGMGAVGKGNGKFVFFTAQYQMGWSVNLGIFKLIKIEIALINSFS